MDVRPFDALLLVSFGGPEKSDDVVPFLQNVTRGRNIPPERLVEVGEHYFAFGGRSPINDQNRALIGAIEKDFADSGIDLPVYWGNRNWDPYLRPTVEQMADDGIRHAACFVTSAYSSYSSCRQYRENLHEAGLDLSVELTKLRQYFNHPGFIGPFVDGTRAALRDLGPAHVVFVTHSIPESMNEASGGPGGGAYLRQHMSVAGAIAAELGTDDWSLAFCSRSGPPHIPWLEPDINDHLETLAGNGVRSVVVVPIGFVSDHMEVVYDLDTEAAATAEHLGLGFARVPTPGIHPAFVTMIRNLVLERAATERGEHPDPLALGEMAPWPDHCGIDCCASAAVSAQPALR